MMTPAAMASVARPAAAAQRYDAAARSGGAAESAKFSALALRPIGRFAHQGQDWARCLREIARVCSQQAATCGCSGVGHVRPRCASGGSFCEIDEFERGEADGEQGARAMQARTHGAHRAVEDGGDAWRTAALRDRTAR